jgi:hypothetical protein
MGVRQLRKLNTDFLMKTIEMARSYNPAEMQAMRDAVQDQIQQQVTPKADEIAEGQGLYTQQPQPPTGTTGTISPTPAQPASQPAIGGEGNP